MLVDSVDEVFRESPPILVGVTLTVLFVVAGLAFRSLLIPLRLLATVVMTLVVTAALTVLLYQIVLGYDGPATLSRQTCIRSTKVCACFALCSSGPFPPPLSCSYSRTHHLRCFYG